MKPKPQSVIYIPDKWSAANFTIMLESDSFHDIEEFVRSKQDVKT